MGPGGSDIQGLWPLGVQEAQEEAEGTAVRRRKIAGRWLGEEREDSGRGRRRTSPGLQGQFLHGVPALTNSPV